MSAWTCQPSDGKAAEEIVPLRPRIPWWKGLGADSEEKREPVSDIDTAVVDSLKALDPKRPIREADIAAPSFDHFVGADKQSGWHSEAERLHLPPDTIEVLDVSVALVGLAVFLTMFAALPAHALKWKGRPGGDAVPPQNMAPAGRARPLDRDCLASNAAARALRA